MLLCPLGCNAQVLSGQLQRHLVKDCQNVAETCYGCN